MKKLMFSLLIATLNLFLITPTASAQGKNVLIVLQENTGQYHIVNWITDPALKEGAKRVIDGLAETFEDYKTKLQAADKYHQVIYLTDNLCTRANLLANLKTQSTNNNIIDLLVIGHGTTDVLQLKGETLTAARIRSMKTENGNQNFKLRLVYMCNCKASTLNDDWLAIGAQTSVGSVKNNYMPEPQITWFLDDFLVKNKTASAAANDSWSASRPFFTGVPGYQRIEDGSTLIDCSKPVVGGNANLRFDQRRLTVGESKTFTIRANVTHNLTHLYLVAGERYRFEATPSTQKWKNGNTQTTATGYNKGLFDAPRQPDFKMMALVGEIFREDNSLFYLAGFLIGTSKTYTAAVSGFLVCHSNDNLAFYGDNTGQVVMKVTRLE